MMAGKSSWSMESEHVLHQLRMAGEQGFLLWMYWLNYVVVRRAIFAIMIGGSYYCKANLQLLTDRTLVWLAIISQAKMAQRYIILGVL